MNNSKQKKIETLKKLQSGEMKLEDLIEKPWTNLDSMFIRMGRHDPETDEEIQKFKEKYPGRDYRIIRFHGPDDE